MLGLGWDFSGGDAFFLSSGGRCHPSGWNIDDTAGPPLLFQCGPTSPDGCRVCSG